jgi:hypothetical protein
MVAPTLRLTAEGKAALEWFMRQITDFDPVASVIWVTSSSAMRLTKNGDEEFENIGPHWGVGFSARERFPASEIVEIDGIPFVFGQGSISDRLNSATLHFVDGRFEVAEGAI